MKTRRIEILMGVLLGVFTVSTLFAVTAYCNWGGQEPSKNMGNYRSFSFYASQPGSAATAWMQPGTAPSNPWSEFWFDNSGSFNVPAAANIPGNLSAGSITSALSDTGSTANAYVVTTSPSITSPTTGLQVIMSTTRANTGASTISITGSSGTAYPITKWGGGTALAGGEISPGSRPQLVPLVFDGTEFQMQSQQGANAPGSFGSLTIGTTNPISLTPATNGNILFGNGISSRIMGSNNAIFGQGAGASLTSDNGGVAIGWGALHSNSGGFLMTAVGYGALYSDTSGGENAAFGAEALYSNTTGNYNVALGPKCLYSNTSGFGGTAAGDAALRNNTTGNCNTAFGGIPLVYNSVGSMNTAYGYQALMNNTASSSNTAVGGNALAFNFSGALDAALGAGALYHASTTLSSVALGYYADYMWPVAPSGVAVSGSGLAVGGYVYRVAFQFSGGNDNSEAGDWSGQIITTAGNQQISLTGIPTYTGPLTCTGRLIYRGIWNSTLVQSYPDFHLVGTIADNTTTTYTDSQPDVTITGDTGNELSGAQLYYVDRFDSTISSTNATVYWSLAYSGGTNTLNVYQDSGKTTLVASGSVAGNGTITLTPTAGYSLAGKVTVRGTANETGSFALGAVPVDPNSSIMIGNGATATKSNQFVAGSPGTNITDVYFGKGVYNTSPSSLTIHGTGGSGTNVAGANVTIVGGLGTGSGGGGSVILQAQPPGGPGSGVTITPRTALTIQAPAGGSAAIAAYATYTFSQLPACAAGIQGSGAVISDGPASPAWHQTVSTGGGTTPMKLFCNGSAWTVEAY